MEPIGLALVGAGAFGEFCLRAFASLSQVRIQAVCDIDVARAETMAFQYQAQAYDNLADLLRDPAIQVVALNTPPYLHAEQGLAVLQSGRHLFCEKPLALTRTDAQALIDAATQNHVLLTVDYVMRYNPFWQAAAHLARSEALGHLRHMGLSNHAAGLSLPAHHWFWDKTQSGGIWIEHGVHFFDAFAWVAGGTGKILASTAYNRADGATDRVEALARFGNTAAHFYHAFDQSGQNEQTAVGLTFEQGYVPLREWAPTSIEIVTPLAPKALIPHLPGEIETRPTSNNRSLIRAYAPEGKAAMVAFVNSIRTGHPLPVSGQHGLASLQLALAAENFTQQADLVAIT
ncbi:MAG: Gfo/Idh/MocA family oxidoreductase [Chloroflexi bacterium]|nr:Gfo/Idh/MocA family oxidoreductase [Chloroflexota bacterium]